jgi:uncharacterized protein YqgC (DUF456 family)
MMLATGALVQYVFSLIGVYLMSIAINMLAENFGGTKNQMQALKVAAYSATAGWLAGIFALIPALGMLSILGLYSLFLVGLASMSSCNTGIHSSTLSRTA